MSRQTISSYQKLTSLLDWAATHNHHQSIMNSMFSSVRFSSSEALPKKESAKQALKFSKERKDFTKKLSVLRKQWAEEHQLKMQQQTQEQTAELERRQAAKSKRAQADAATRESKLQQLLAQQQAERETRLQEKHLRLQRHELRMDIQEAAREERRQALLKQSVHWVDPGQLDQRIEEALNNPTPLWPKAL